MAEIKNEIVFVLDMFLQKEEYIMIEYLRRIQIMQDLRLSCLATQNSCKLFCQGNIYLFIYFCKGGVYNLMD